MLSIPKYPEQYAQHFPAIFYLLCCASQHHVMELEGRKELVDTGKSSRTWSVPTVSLCLAVLNGF